MALTTPTTTAPSYKKISPYDLSSNDNSGVVISQPLLNGQNYDEWALNLRIALSSRKKFGFLDGSVPRPAAGADNLEDWIANNHLLVGWIKLTIEPKLRSSITTREIARELWDLIKRRFSVKSGARLQQLRNSLATCKQSGTSIDDYFGRLTHLWDGIAECTVTKLCSCGMCTCDLNTARDKELDILKVHDFLAGLDEAVHGAVRSQICAIAPLPNLDTVYQTILQNETLNSGVAKEIELMSFISQVSRQVPSSTIRNGGAGSQHVNSSSTQRTSHANKDPSRFCTGCNRSGHEITSCFRVVGYPEWWDDKSRKPDNRNTRGRGRSSQPRAVANSTQISSANVAAAPSNSSLLTDLDRQGLSGFSDEQWRTIKLAINSNASERLSGPCNEDPDWSG